MPICIADPEPTIVPDLTKDERFSSMSIVKGYPHLIFYAGFPLITHEGLILGTLCDGFSTQTAMRANKINEEFTINICHQIINLQA